MALQVVDMAVIDIKPKDVVKEVSLAFKVNKKRLNKLRGALNDKYKGGPGEPLPEAQEPGLDREADAASE